jgi:hypothetical protein
VYDILKKLPSRFGSEEINPRIYVTYDGSSSNAYDLWEYADGKGWNLIIQSS